MKARLQFAICAATVIVAIPFAVADELKSDDVTGQWLTEDEDAKILIFKDEDGAYSGKMIWLVEPLFPADDPEAGKIKRDRKNPDRDPGRD